MRKQTVSLTGKTAIRRAPALSFPVGLLGGNIDGWLGIECPFINLS